MLRRFVERAGREAGRHRHPLEHPSPDVRHSLGNRFLVEVDPVPVAGGERPRVSGVLGEADQQQRDGGDADHPEMPRTTCDVRGLRRRQPAGYLADQRHAVVTEVEQ